MVHLKRQLHLTQGLLRQDSRPEVIVVVLQATSSESLLVINNMQ